MSANGVSYELTRKTKFEIGRMCPPATMTSVGFHLIV